MIVAIMQPYFFPYIGYFQLMHVADVFVFHDDVQYIKSGWINRNRILTNNHVDWLTMPVKNASNYLPINQRYFATDPSITDKMKRRLRASYAKSPGFDGVARTIFELLDFPDANVAAFNCSSLMVIARMLGIRCEFVKSSELGLSAPLKGQDKVIGLCRKFGADQYVNPIGGVGLYDATAFADAGIELSFLQTTVSPTPTLSGPQHLSIIDGLIRHGFDGYSDLLPECALLRSDDLQSRA